MDLSYWLAAEGLALLWLARWQPDDDRYDAQADPARRLIHDLP